MVKRKTTRLIKKNAKQGTDAYTFNVSFKGDLKDLQKQDLVNEQGKKYGTVEIYNGKATVAIILPKFIRENNIQPFTLMDSIYLELIKSDCEKQLRKLLGTNELKSSIKAIECNITQKVSGNATQSDVLNLLGKSLLSKEQDNLKYVGPSNNCSLKEETRTLIVKRNHYYIFKAYDKEQQQRKQGTKNVPSGLLRLEIIMVDRTLTKLFGNKISFQDVLTKDGLIAVIREYKKIFVNEIIEDKVKKCLSNCSMLLLESLCETESPIDTIANERELIVDKEVLRKALKKWQRIRGVKDNSCRDIETYTRKFYLPQDVILTLSQCKNSCG